MGQPLEKGVQKFEIALGIFFKKVFGPQLLEKGVLKFQTALELFFKLSWVAALQEGSPEI